MTRSCHPKNKEVSSSSCNETLLAGDIYSAKRFQLRTHTGSRRVVSVVARKLSVSRVGARVSLWFLLATMVLVVVIDAVPLLTVVMCDLYCRKAVGMRRMLCGC
jgi:hypothetical protein